MHIGIDASRANKQQKTGVEQYAFHVIQELKHIIPSDIRVTLYSAEPLRGGLEQLPAHWESCVLPWKAKYVWTHVRLAFHTLFHPPDLLFVPAHVPPLFFRGTLIVTLHDVAFLTHPHLYRFLGRQYLKLMYWFAAKRSKKIITVSEFSKKEIVRLLHVSPEKIVVTHLGVMEEGRGKTGQGEPTQGPFTSLKSYFLFVGRLESKKNIEGLLAAYALYRKNGGVQPLILVGKRGYGGDAALSGNHRGVIEKGFVNDEELNALYSNATALVFPSLYEGFGLPVIEAFLRETPVILSREGSLPEIGGDAALYVDAHDPNGVASAMARIEHDAELRERLVMLGKERVKMFTWKKTAEKTWEILKKFPQRVL